MPAAIIQTNYSCNAQFNFTALQPNVSYSRPLVLRVADNQIYGQPQPQFPFTLRLATSSLTKGNVVEFARNYYKGCTAPATLYILNNYYVPAYPYGNNYPLSPNPVFNFPTVRFTRLSLQSDALLVVADNEYDTGYVTTKNSFASPIQFPSWGTEGSEREGGGFPVAMDVAGGSQFVFRNNRAGKSLYALSDALPWHPVTACQLAAPSFYYPNASDACAYEAAQNMQMECVPCPAAVIAAGGCGEQEKEETYCVTRLAVGISPRADVNNYTLCSAGVLSPNYRRVFNFTDTNGYETITGCFEPSPTITATRNGFATYLAEDFIVLANTSRKKKTMTTPTTTTASEEEKEKGEEGYFTPVAPPSSQTWDGPTTCKDCTCTASTWRQQPHNTR